MPAVRGPGNERERISDLAPANNLVAISPHDTTELTYFTRAIYVGTGGDITVKASADSAADA